MLKKILSLVLLTGLFLTLIPVSAETTLFGEDYSRRIDAYGFEFVLKDSADAETDSLTANGSISANCKIKRTTAGTGSQGVTLVVSVYDGGKLIGCKTKKATASEVGVEIPVALDEAITLPSDVSKVRAYGYIWSDFVIPKILARPATLNSSVNTLYELNINGETFKPEDVFDEENTFVCELPKIPKNLPEVTAKADDLGAKIDIENISALPGVAKVNVTSQTGETKAYNIDFSVKVNERVVADAISADTNSRTSQYLTNYSPTGIWMQTNLYNGVPMTNSFLGTLKRALIQLDVTKFPDDTTLIKNINLTVTGQCNYVAGHITPYCPAGILINAYDFSEYVWDETTVDAAATSVGPTLAEIVAKTPFDSFFVEKTDSTAGPWVEKSVNVTELVKKAKETGKEKITVILLADNSSRNTPELAALKNQNSNNRDELMFVMGTRENTTESRRPKVTIEEYEREE